MRILLATGAMYPEPGGAPVVSPDAGLTAPEVASAIASGWRARRDDDALTALPIPDGGPGTAQAVGAGIVSARRALQAYSPLGEVREVDLLQLRGAHGARARSTRSRPPPQARRASMISFSRAHGRMTASVRSASGT